MTVMRGYSNSKIWFPALLLLIVATGCSDPDKSGTNPTVTPPTVISVAPPSGASSACPSTVATATFSVAMNPATINATTFTLTAGTPPVAVAGVITPDPTNTIFTFTPNAPGLALSTTYTATITTGATDAYGIALASNFAWTVTTSGEACAPPTVISVTPLAGAVGVCPSTAVTATFSEAMNPATINTTTFTLTGPGTTPVAGVVTYAGSTATFTPNSPGLALATLYTATITTGAQDLNGDALASNKVWTFTTAAAACAPPTVISVAPPNGATGICQNTVVVATFSEAMNPATINTATFTLTGPGVTAVGGTVSYDAATDAATFTPNSPGLALDTLYTATITTGAQDLGGNALASNKVWTFTTAAAACTTVPPVPLGTACMFGILAATPAVANSGPTNVTGDIGIWPAAAITGFPPGTLTGTEYAGDAVAQTAQGDLTTAYNFAAAAAGGAILTADIGGQTLAPGVYKTTSAQPSLGITGTLTLSGNGVYIFQIVSTLTTAANNSDVVLSGGATAEDVFWQVGSSATLGTTTTFEGTIMAQASVSLDTGATLNGRALARTGAVTLLSNPVNVPPCP
jgi:Ice-binding-like/Bacterial Ig-like domain